MSSSKEKSEFVDVEKIVEQGKTILKGGVPTSKEEIKSAIEGISSGVEQIRYNEGEKLSSTGKSILKDLEEILVGGKEVTEAIPPETFMHAARAQQKVTEATKSVASAASQEGKEGKERMMDFTGLIRMVLTSGEFRGVVSEWSNWLKDVLLLHIRQEPIPTTAGQVPTTPILTAAMIPDEQLDKLFAMLEWIQEREEYQRGVGYIWTQFKYLSALIGVEGEDVELSRKETGEEQEEEPIDRVKLKEAMEEAKLTGLDTIKALQNWTHRSFDPFVNHLNRVSDHLKSDESLFNSLQSLAHFFGNCLTEPGFLNDRRWIRQEASERLKDFRDTFTTQNYYEDFSKLADEFNEILTSLDTEPRTVQLKEGLRKLLEDLFVEEGGAGVGAVGGFRLKTELINDLGVLIDDLFKRVRFLRIPDIEIHDEDLDFRAHNIILDASELIPQQFKLTLVTENMVEREENKKTKPAEVEGEVIEAPAGPRGLEKQQFLGSESFKTFSPRTTASTSTTAPFKEAEQALAPAPVWQTHLKFEVKGIRGHCRNVHFNIRKKTGFPQLTDEGEADLRVWGPKGMLVKVVIRPEWLEERTVKQEVIQKETLGTRPIISSQLKPTLSKTEVESTTTTSTTPVKSKVHLAIVKAVCEIDELDLDLHGTRRDWIYSVLGPVVRKRVKSSLEEAVQENLMTLMD